MNDAVWLDDRQQTLWRAFFDMRHHLDRAIDDQLAEHGLSTADYTVLLQLSEAPDHAMRVRDLGERIAWESSRLAHHLRRMEGRGLIVRGDHPSDRRGTVVHITESGMTSILGAAPGHARAVRRFFVDLLSDGEVDVLTALSQRVCRTILDAR